MKLFKKRVKQEGNKRERLLLEQYNKGMVLHVDDPTDNVAYFKSLEEKDGIKEVAE